LVLGHRVFGPKRPKKKTKERVYKKVGGCGWVCHLGNARGGASTLYTLYFVGCFGPPLLDHVGWNAFSWRYRREQQHSALRAPPLYLCVVTGRWLTQGAVRVVVQTDDPPGTCWNPRPAPALRLRSQPTAHGAWGSGGGAWIAKAHWVHGTASGVTRLPRPQLPPVSAIALVLYICLRMGASAC
jgi:hypothetical protein